MLEDEQLGIMLWEYEEFGVKQLRYSPCRRQTYLRVRLDHVDIARKSQNAQRMFNQNRNELA